MVMILPANQSALDLPLQDYPTANRSAILELPLQDFDPTANQSEKSAARIYARFSILARSFVDFAPRSEQRAVYPSIAQAWVKDRLNSD